MSTSGQTRLELIIDVFEKPQQRAQPLPELTPPQLVEAILREFRELEYLSHVPANYRLEKLAGTLLQADIPLREQVTEADNHLVLVEEEQPLPADTERPSLPIYLREQTSGTVYKLQWQPAIIGRPDASQPHNDRLAVNLETYKTGLRVSRRHAEITERDGCFYIATLSNNPTMLQRDEERAILTNTPYPLQNGDIIFLERSAIALKFIVRSPGSLEEEL